MQRRGLRQEECERLMSNMLMYKAGVAPYHLPCGGEGWDLSAWWSSLRQPSEQDPLRDLAILLADVKPCAVDPDAVLSVGGWFKEEWRKGLGAATANAILAVKLDCLRDLPR